MTAVLLEVLCRFTSARLDKPTVAQFLLCEVALLRNDLTKRASGCVPERATV